MTYGYFTADISTGVTCAHSTRPSPGCASGVLRNGHSFPPADAFVVSAQHNPLLRTDGFIIGKTKCDGIQNQMRLFVG